MSMTLYELCAKQFQLDNFIVGRLKADNPNASNKNFIVHRLLHTFVETGELINEFLIYSNETSLEEYADVLHFIISCKNTLDINTELDSSTLEEIYNNAKEMADDVPTVDRAILLFISSISQLVNSVRAGKYWSIKNGIAEKEEIVNEKYIMSLKSFFLMGYKLRFSIERIELAYLKKNKENIERQWSNY